jgi:Fe-S oxidoreductase
MPDPVKLAKPQTEIKRKAKDYLPKGGNLDLCFTCGTCTSGCPSSGNADMDPRKFLRMVLLGMDEELKKHDWLWMCTMCQRCIKACPMEIDIPRLIYYMRSQVPREERPKGIRASCDVHLRVGSAIGVPDADWQFVVEDVLEEFQGEQPGFADMQAPMDKKGTKYIVNQNSREPGAEPEEMVPLWKILHLAGADWTYPGTAWAGENYCMFIADDKDWETIVRKQVAMMEDLGGEVFVNTECGHSYFAISEGMKKFKVEHSFDFKHIVELYAEWIKEGKLKPSSEWNKDLQIKFTVQDPCQFVRKTLGEYAANCLRYVVKACVGEENLIDMYPNSINNYCCGGGGGMLQSGYNEERLKYGKIKFDQIKATGATYCVTPCHNCHAQIESLNEHYDGGYHTIHLWTLLALALGVLGPRERTYLGDDLKDVWVYDGGEGVE